jgi:hypothetical protein
MRPEAGPADARAKATDITRNDCVGLARPVGKGITVWVQCALLIAPYIPFSDNIARAQ